MFKASQILTRTKLLKHFNLVARHLSAHPQALLITQRGSEPLVLVNAEIWETFLEERLQKDVQNAPNTFLNEEIRIAES